MVGGSELRTPLEMALKREAEGELAGGCIKCDYCVVVQGVAYCGISGKMLLPQFIDTPIRCKKRTEAMKMGLTGADLARLGPAAQRQVLEKVGILGKGGKKYHNQEDIRGRIHFDSRKEAARYGTSSSSPSTPSRRVTLRRMASGSGLSSMWPTSPMSAPPCQTATAWSIGCRWWRT